METDPTRMSELLVGLGEVDLVGIGDLGEGAPLEVVIRSRKPRPLCGGCGSPVWSKGERTVWWICRRSDGRFGCGGGNGGGCARTPTVRSDRSSKGTPRLVPNGRC